MRTKRRSELTWRKKLIQDLDREASLWCRSLRECEKCGFTHVFFGFFHAHHISRRGNTYTRWHKRNLKCLCPTCHQEVQNNIELEDAVFGKRRCERLRLLGKQLRKYTAFDLKLKLEEVKNWPRRSQ